MRTKEQQEKEKAMMIEAKKYESKIKKEEKEEKTIAKALELETGFHVN
jgi:hypothetical protein